MHDDRKYELRLFVIKGGYDAVDYSDGRLCSNISKRLAASGIPAHAWHRHPRAIEATSLLAKGKDTSVFGLNPH